MKSMIRTRRAKKVKIYQNNKQNTFEGVDKTVDEVNGTVKIN